MSVIKDNENLYAECYFSSKKNIKKYLPGNIFNEIFDEISDDLKINELIKTNDKNVYLDNAAFGRAYSDVISLSLQLKGFAEENPDIFYDQLCVPLTEYTYQVLSEFFNSENVLLVPNCTFGMNAIQEYLIREKRYSTVALLNPLYKATQAQLETLQHDNLINKIVYISPGTNALFEEDANIFISSITKKYNECNFEVLFCDAVASESGRVLPLKEICEFCETKKIVLVVDGTQCCELLLKENINILQHVDYFVMSTHKWIGNVKTCGVIRFKTIEACPRPPAISYGWNNSKRKTYAQIKAGYLWLGMLDTYISYITLSKALKIFKKYGKAQLQYAASLLNNGLLNTLGVKPLLPKTRAQRVINTFELTSCQYCLIKNLKESQEAFQDFGVFVSIKSTEPDCFLHESKDSIKDNDTKKVLSNKESVCNHKNLLCNGNNNYSYSEEQMSQNFEFTSSHMKFVRVSCWTYNTSNNFVLFANIFKNSLSLTKTKDSGIRRQFLHTFDLYEKLFSVLKPEAFFVRAEPLRHHLIFYFAHTAVFYINKLVVSGYLDSKMRIDPIIESIMSVGVDEMSWDDWREDNYVWSTYSSEKKVQYIEGIKSYRIQVKKLILQLLDSHPITLPINSRSFHWVILMGIEHENVHLETSAVIISQVPPSLIKKRHNFNFPTYYSKKSLINGSSFFSCKNLLVDIPGGKIFMGKDNLESDIYGWDNEYGSEEKLMLPFKASQMLVSNAEFLEFVEAGGYTEFGKKWWSTEGWSYVTELKVTMPRFWVNKNTYRSLLKEIPMPWDFPVEVNNLEAEAFCRWKSETSGIEVRLISMEESFHMRALVQNETINTNLNKYASPTPVNLFGGLIGGKMIYDVSGNVWRHSCSFLTIMNGFKIDPLYDDYTIPLLDGFHNLLLGGSWISVGNSANMNTRYAFRRHFYQYAGIRYVKSENDFNKRVHKMFSNLVIGEKLTEHYTNFVAETFVEKKPVSNWPLTIGNKAVELINEYQNFDTERKFKVMFVNGGAGRAALEILRKCSNLEIEFTDKTANNLQLLKSLLEESSISWLQKLEGEIAESTSFYLKPEESKENLLEKKNNIISFYQMDYKNMKPFFKDYDWIVADFRHNNACHELQEITKRLKINGTLVLGSIDNVHAEDSNIDCFSFLKQNFVCLETTEHPHMYKESKNNYKYAISYLSVWKKLTDNTICIQPSLISKMEIHKSTNYYDNENTLKSYELLHYGEELFSVKNFPMHIAEVCILAARKYKTGIDSALDAGCGPGRTAIELCGTFKQVVAYDYSSKFVELMEIKQKEKNVLNLITFQGDSHCQKKLIPYQMFDLILGCNLIDFLHTPKEWLIQSKAILKPNGIFVISSPYSWNNEYTAIVKWIGGKKKNGENYFTIDGIKDILSPELILLEVLCIPFVIPDADGTYQYTHSICTIFGAPSVR
ncbi:uncharacterized protein LOC124819331 isoform X2 [Hydra vulgaris]|uniref:Uncharacterized protein LOC124819331 isoform X2 n=1 Tax=Hydra vulgaris TaxID=6087 RepID=A0ABM4DIU3_HYDVU